MPAAVEAFSRTANMREVRARQKEIVEWYREDIAKYVGEVDFMLPWALDSVIPVEVKSGKTYKRHSALTKLLKVENYDIERAFVLYEGNVQVDGLVTYLPIYMAMFLGLC